MKKKILVVDDERSICLMLENFLSRHYDVVWFQKVADAILWLEGNLPDIIISDIEMPEADGFELLIRVRQRGFTKHTPFIMLSAKAESKERIKCYRLGAQDYLIKPFNPEELAEIVKKNINPIHYALAW